MKQNRKNESGRSMLEVIAIVAIVFFLTIGGLAGYSYLIQKFKRNESADQVDQLVLNVKTSGAANKINGATVISPNTVIAGPKMDKGENKILLPDSGDAIVYALEGSAFKLDVNVQEDTCEALLKFFEEGHPDAVVYMGDGLLANNASINEEGVLRLLRTLGKDEKEEFCLKVKGLRAASFFFECPGGSSSYYYYYDNECHICPQDRPDLDVAGNCCKFADHPEYCGGRCSACADGTTCSSSHPEDTSGRCVGCLKDYECIDKMGWAGHVCWNHECMECTSDSHCVNKYQYTDKEGDKKEISNPHPGYNTCFSGKCGCKRDKDCYDATTGTGNPSTPICNQGTHTCTECPNGVDENGNCIQCPSGTILHDGECVACYDPGDGSKPHRGCTNDKPICNSLQKTTIDGTEYAGKCVECIVDSDCPAKTDGDKWCDADHACHYCPQTSSAADQYKLYRDKKDDSCHACIDNKAGAGHDTGCPLPTDESDHYLCGGTGSNGSGAYADACFKCYDNNTDSTKDDGCSSGKPLCEATSEKFGNTCHVCKGSAAGAGTDLGCSSSLPICADADKKPVSSGTYGTMCGKCINDSESDQDTGCTKSAPNCNGAWQNGVGTTCSTCPSGQVTCSKSSTGCAVCCDDEKGLTMDPGCSAQKAMCSDAAGSTKYQTGGSHEPGTVCYECFKNDDCKDESKPLCGSNHLCTQCPDATPVWDPSSKQCVTCRDTAKGVSKDSGCSSSKKLCGAGENTGNGKAGSYCGICIDDVTGNGKDTGCTANAHICVKDDCGDSRGSNGARKCWHNHASKEVGTRCVECIFDSNCPQEKPHCNQTSFTCESCDKNHYWDGKQCKSCSSSGTSSGGTVYLCPGHCIRTNSDNDANGRLYGYVKNASGSVRYRWHNMVCAWNTCKWDDFFCPDDAVTTEYRLTRTGGSGWWVLMSKPSKSSRDRYRCNGNGGCSPK